MKLFLSSYYFGNHPEDFSSLIGENKNVAIIMNATDARPIDMHAAYLEKEVAKMANLELKADELDLKNYFNDNDSLKTKLKEYGAVWVMGGNVFLLRRAMQQSGFDKLIIDMLKDDSIVYGGFSAGNCVTGETLHGIELVDNPNDTAEGYNSEIIWDGLGLIDYSIVPHYKSDHKESAEIEKVVDYYKAHNMPYKTLSDGDAIVISK